MIKNKTKTETGGRLKAAIQKKKNLYNIITRQVVISHHGEIPNNINTLTLTIISFSTMLCDGGQFKNIFFFPTIFAHMVRVHFLN